MSFFKVSVSQTFSSISESAPARRAPHTAHTTWRESLAFLSRRRDVPDVADSLAQIFFAVSPTAWMASVLCAPREEMFIEEKEKSRSNSF